ncbi:MFS transporter [Evansella cellulosilytica]|uniref:Major facilitator superfamily MFS_1 n=1 Tax=Evansella cellulosilytica (strain ATCC 21833 / DSM 2522 / FERM P-1141 / JCM 9156 / N-4) TaxID=649639 RepID=E6TR73_EVAC2|nr:MFS transporter [Evansella cellulosilytica]ADU30585.1 major facilitator superfamily MFS_1 [Evansella cellulosilytica DSM 2522]
MTSTSSEIEHSFKILRIFNFAIYGTMALLMPYLPLYFQGAGFTNVQIGILMASGPFVSLIANPFWGYWSDKLQNTRKVLTIMLIGNLILSQIFFQMTIFVYVFAIMLFFFFFQTALNPMSNSIILHAIQNTRYQFGTFRLWGSLGFAIMAGVASPFIQMIGTENLGYIYGAFMIVVIFLCFGLPSQGKASGKVSFSGFTKLFKNGYFTAFLLLGILISIPNRMNATFISIFISDLGGGEIYVGASWLLAAILEVPVFLILDRYLRHSERLMMGLLGLVSLLFAIRWLLMSIAPTPLSITFIQLLHGFSFGIYFYTGTQLCALLIPDKYRASGQALYALAWMGVSGIIAGVIGGWIFDTLGARQMYSVGMWMSIIGALGFAFIWMLQKNRGKRS